MKQRIILFYIAVCTATSAFSQAGNGVFRFLDLPVSARLNALGGTNVSLQEHELSFAFMNPALLSSETHNMITLNYALYLSDIMFGSAMYGYNYGKNYFAAGINYIDYGKFNYADEVGELSGGQFTAKDIAMNLIYARQLNRYFTVGATLKPIYSVYEHYTSFGLATDIGAHFLSKSQLFSAGLVFRNMGVQLKGYYEEEGIQHREALPFDIQLGISQKLSHAPIRLSLTLHNLQHWNLDYQITNQQSTTLDESTTNNTEIKWYDMAFRHAIIAIDIIPTKNIYLALSYNHRRHQELSTSSFKSLSGFAIGAGVRIYKFHVGFAMSQYQLGNYTYQFSLSTSLDDFNKL